MVLLTLNDSVDLNITRKWPNHDNHYMCIKIYSALFVLQYKTVETLFDKLVAIAMHIDFNMTVFSFQIHCKLYCINVYSSDRRLINNIFLGFFVANLSIMLSMSSSISLCTYKSNRELNLSSPIVLLNLFFMYFKEELALSAELHVTDVSSIR